MRRGTHIRTGLMALAVGGLMLAPTEATASSKGRILERFAREFGCPVGDVTVNELGAGGWSASGCGVSATYSCESDQNMWVEESCRLDRVHERPRAPRLLIRDLNRVTVKRDDFTDKTVVELRLKIDGTGFFFIGVPDVKQDLIKLAVQGMNASAWMQSCSSMALKLDDQVLRIESVQHEQRAEGNMVIETWGAHVPMATLRQIVSATVVKARLCRRVWELNPYDRGLLRDFLMQFDAVVAKQPPAPTAKAPVSTPSE